MTTIRGWTHAYQDGALDASINPADSDAEVGDALIVVIMDNGITDGWTAHAGFTALMPRLQTGTRGTQIFAGRWAGGTLTFPRISGSGGRTIMVTALADAPDVEYWRMGATGPREVTGTSSTNVAPGVSAKAGEMVLTFSTEATNATEGTAPTVSGATSYAYAPQDSASNIECIVGSYFVPGSDTTTGRVTTTYPNTQTNNGFAAQVCIAEPPATPNVLSLKSFATPALSTYVAVTSDPLPTLTGEDEWLVALSQHNGVEQACALTGLTNSPSWTSGIQWLGSNALGQAWVVPLSEEDSGNRVTVTWDAAGRPLLAWAVVKGETPDAAFIAGTTTLTTRDLPTVAAQDGVVVTLGSARRGSSMSEGSMSFSSTYADITQIASPNSSSASTAIIAAAGDGLGSGEGTATHTGQRSMFLNVSFAPPSDPPREDIPQIASLTTANVGSGTTITLDTPEGTEAGDLLVAVLRAQSATVDALPTPPAGWVHFGPEYVPANASARQNSLWKRRATADEPASHTWTYGSDAQRHAAVMLRLTGETPVIGGASTVYVNAGTPRTVLAFPTQVPALHIATFAAEVSAGNTLDVTAPEGFEPVTSAVNGSAGNSQTHVKVYASAADYSPTDPTPFVASDWAAASCNGFTVAFKAPVVSKIPDPNQNQVLIGEELRAARLLVKSASGVKSITRSQLIRPGFESVEQMLETHGVTWGHRGNSIRWPEMSMRAYTETVAIGYGVLEISLGRTSDGVWFGLHDQDMTRTTGGISTANASDLTWAQVQELPNVTGTHSTPQPYLRFEDLVHAYGRSHIIVTDRKYAHSHDVEYFAMLNALLDPERVIVKYYGSALSHAAAAASAGFTTWGFMYQTDGTENIATWANSWSILGLDIEASQETWDFTTGLEKPVIAHLAATQAKYDEAISKGAFGVQCRNSYVIAPVSVWNAGTVLF